LSAHRIDQQEERAYRPGHRTGNRLFTGFFAAVFYRTFTDILSGYRVFSRRFREVVSGAVAGFEIETELSVHALELDLRWARSRRPITRGRPDRTRKLSTWRDGLRILPPSSGSTARSGRLLLLRPRYCPSRSILRHPRYADLRDLSGAGAWFPAFPRRSFPPG
jgi:hypothetical protein